MKTGDMVIYHNPTGVPHSALLTAVWGTTDDCLVNLVYISSDESEQDSYGRQMKRETSVHHVSKTNVHGRYWRKQEEQANKVVAPVSA